MVNVPLPAIVQVNVSATVITPAKKEFLVDDVVVVAFEEIVL
jgi:hypothetical protein